MLQGARLVIATETEQDRAWAESKIKQRNRQPTPLRQDFMRADFFEFRPRFKLMISGMHRPALKSVDAAIRRQFHLVPFTVKIPRRGAHQRLR